MSNVIAFPQRPRVEVTPGTDKATGETVYVFDLLDGHDRNNLAIFTRVEEATSEACCLMVQGYDVTWDEPRRRLFWDHDPRGAA
ncbi:hypothetical protein [Sinorhizobium psoraleae]|uniref:Uncharacterized protein n=1 Tax=Sinorhizobium psoraleae TaxID=520838 RepID=A0ABT4KIK9_9HYPH|nr:hypothetical protein [Sinorhizobium psoraleae]MCZ4091678.1 hypothetical protein [Sinorhizobium psoraleae]